MKNLNYLSKIGGYFSASQSNDVSLDRRFTVGSPSGFNSKLMLKLVSVLVLILTIGSGNVWGQTTVSKSVSEIYGDVANGTQECTLWDDDVLSISVNCNGNNGKVYGTGTEWRLYQGNSAVVTISVTSGELTSVTLTFTNSNNGKISYSGSALTSGSAVAVSGSSADFTVGATSGTSGQIRLSAFSVTYSSGGGGCTPGDVSSLSAGDVVVMYYSTNELDGVSSGYGSKSTFTTSPDGDFPLTVERGYNNTGFSFKNGSYYLRMNAGNSNTALELSTTKDASASWNVSFDGSKVATIQNCNYTTRYIKYNTSSPRFATYLTGVNNTYNVKLYKICDDTKYTVTYNGNGNTSGSVPTDNTEYDSGDEVTVKGNTGSLAKTGYTFGGWNTQADGNGTNYTAGSGTFNISANTTLYAKWIPTYNVYLASGCIGGSYTSSEGTSGSGTGIYDGYAKYSGITAGTSVTITASPTSGYQFDGWTDGGYSIILDDESNEITPSSSTATSATFSMPSSDVIIWACYFSETCNKSMNINKGTETNCTFTLSQSGSSIASCSGVTTMVTVTPTTGYGNPSVTQSGASATPTISGSGNSWTVIYGNNTTGTSTINVSCSANNYTITLDKDLTPTTPGTASITATYNANTNLTSAITKPTKTGWTFGGYFTAKNGGGTQIIDASGNVIASVSGYTDASRNWKYAGNITLYAKWTCEVTWSVNGATNVYSSQTVTYNSSGSKVASVPTPDPASYCGDIFAGWSAKNAGAESKTTSYYDDLFKTVGDSPDIKSIGNITFYAVFADEDED